MALKGLEILVNEEHQEQDTLLSVENLHMKYNEGKENEVYVLKGMDFTISAGQMVAIMGPSGCGKTTLLNLIGGLDQSSSGAISIDQAKIDQMQDDELTRFRRDNIGYIFQLFNLFEDQTALQNVILPLLLQHKDVKSAKQLGKMMLLDVGLGDRVDDVPAKLSGGEQQKVAIARSLITQPKLILADEPTGDLDEATSDDIMALFRRLQQENPRTSIIVVTHSERIAGQCDRILHIEDGRIESDRYLEEVVA
ncbi:MAG: ABC transporter ATP-binding protein [Candidatus Heimdallarchaeota archaeon]|nr:ABC transporter ATP-binding protein [Candidatus Heimdallarchaeota archaeon]